MRKARSLSLRTKGRMAIALPFTIVILIIFTTYFFCYGDIELISDQFRKFLNNEIKEVKSVSTVEPTLSFILCPKGAKAIRHTGEEIEYYTINNNKKEKIKKVNYNTSNYMIIEFDFCINGRYGVQHWSVVLTEKESMDFCKQWLAEMQDEKT